SCERILRERFQIVGRCAGVEALSELRKALAIVFKRSGDHDVSSKRKEQSGAKGRREAGRILCANWSSVLFNGYTICGRLLRRNPPHANETIVRTCESTSPECPVKRSSSTPSLQLGKVRWSAAGWAQA